MMKKNIRSNIIFLLLIVEVMCISAFAQLPVNTPHQDISFEE